MKYYIQKNSALKSHSSVQTPNSINMPAHLNDLLHTTDRTVPADKPLLIPHSLSSRRTVTILSVPTTTSHISTFSRHTHFYILSIGISVAMFGLMSLLKYVFDFWKFLAFAFVLHSPLPLYEERPRWYT